MIERYRGYDCVWSSVDDTYTVYRNGVRLACCRTKELRKCIDHLEEVRTHEERPVYGPVTYREMFLNWLADIPSEKAHRIIKQVYIGMLVAWIVFAVVLFFGPDIFP